MKPGCVWCAQTWWSPAAHDAQRPQAQTNGTVTRSPTAPAAHAGADRLDRAGELVARHVRQHDVGVVALPAVPVAAADPAGAHADHDATGRRTRRRYLPDLQRAAEAVEDECAHRDQRRRTRRAASSRSV